MLKRSIRTPVTVLACALFCGAALIAISLEIALDDGNWAPIRGDIRIGLATTVVVAFIRLVQVVRTEAHDELSSRLDGHELRLNRHAERIEEAERTQPIPRLRVAGAVVGTAVVRPVDPDVISIAARLQDRMNDH